MLELDGDRVYNTALVFAPSGRLAVRYRKVFPWRPFETVNRGTDAPPVFRIPGVGQLGVMICYDGSFPEMARSLALRGAEVILHPTLTSTPDRDQELVMAQANAIANQCYVLNVNAVSTYANGRSIGVDPHGRVLFELGEGESFAIETLDLDLVRASRRHGSRDLSRLLQHVREAPPAVFDAYRDLGDRT
jgi:formamidase